MKQVTKNKNVTVAKKTKPKKVKDNRLPQTESSVARKKEGFKRKLIRDKNKPHPQYGTSKLEEDFAHMFLDKLGVKYEYQFEAKDIGRFYDFYLPESGLIIEIDGGWWHSDPRVVDESKLKYHQKKQKDVDALKDRWALMHGIPIIRIWEYDIRNNPKEVMKTLKKRLYLEDEKKILEENKKKPHINKLKKDKK